MSQQLPPLNALRAFEAVTRHLSFTRAAEELNVTRAAISHQIKYLEDFLGLTLIERKSRRLVLTGGAEAALPKLRAGFDSLAEAVSLMRGARPAESITVWTAPSFASKWLVPRLHRFSQHHPDIDMQISSDASLVDADFPLEKKSMESFFLQHGIDVIIRFGSSRLSSVREEKLFPVMVVPLCSPELVSDSHPHPLKKPEDLVFHTLLHDDTAYVGRPDWSMWLELQGIEGVKANRGLHFNHVALALDAAVDGQGVLLSLNHLAQLDIEAGKLCIPFDLPMPLEQAYYVMRPQTVEANQPAVEAFVDWLKAEAAAQML
ncbi:MAG: transcriptional regulator GcvA [Gammaproteobacteria bacterium]|nr:transcriptional regulator GcvA [Gammaproteobacteria bacterium]MBU1722772.1 transcriptional regulator GcvA [Gammaproteobacteria bacterium]MBU2005201.1 transcriptional regulator GcvA [Gammaproteobacteria bacterium]